MRVRANGREVQLEDPAALTDLFDALGVAPGWVVAEVNGVAIERSRMGDLRLSDGDRVELVRAVAGG